MQIDFGIQLNYCYRNGREALHTLEKESSFTQHHLLVRITIQIVLDLHSLKPSCFATHHESIAVGDSERIRRERQSGKANDRHRMKARVISLFYI